MAVLDTNKTKKPYIVDREENTFIGLDLPFRFGAVGEGWGASTQITLDAVRNDLKNLISTELGERLYQPNLGVALRKYLFEPFSETLVEELKATIYETVSFWLPFVEINAVNVSMSESQGEDMLNTMEVNITFSLKKDKKTLESVQIKVGE